MSLALRFSASSLLALSVALAISCGGAELSGPSGTGGSGGASSQGGAGPQSSASTGGGDAGSDGSAPNAEPFYVLDLSARYLNCFGGCKAGVAAHPVATTLENLDALVFATSVEGLVNRTGPRLYVIATPADAFWLEQATDGSKPWGWAAAHPRKNLSSVEELITTFAADISHTVQWAADQPSTLNLATMASGVEGLAIVRKTSPLAASITAAWPIAHDFAGQFQNKREASSYAHQTYLAQTKPGFLGYQLDGWPWTRLIAGSDGSDFGGPNILARDYLIAKKAYVFDLSPWPDQAPIDDPTQPNGADRGELVGLLDAAHSAVQGQELGTMWGFYPIEKYATGVHQEPVSGEWTTAELISEHGVRLTGNGGQAYGLEAANASFHQWGSFPRHAPRPASPAPNELADLGYVNQRLLNPGFDWDSLGAWEIDTTNRAIYPSNGAPDGHEYFLEMNGSVGQSLGQVVPIAPKAGETWRLRVQYRLAEPTSRAKLVLWGLGGGNEAAQVLLTQADGQWHTGEVTYSPSTNVHTAMKAQVYLDAAGPSVDVDEFRLARVTPWSNDVAPLTFTTFFEGDYDMGTPIYTTPVAVSPKVWTDPKRGTIPVAWDFAPDTIDYYPGVFHYYYATATALDWFTVPDSGGGYVNPSYLSPSDRALFLRTSRRAMGKTGESFLSFFLNGFAASPAADVAQAWNAVGPDGVLANQLSAPDHRMVDNVGWCAVDGNGWSYGGISDGDAIQNLAKAYSDRYGAAGGGAGPRFLAGRNVYTGPSLASTMVAQNRSAHPERDITVVGPYTFGYLFREASGGSNTQRASWIDDTLSRSPKAGAPIKGTVTVRNDGWETWAKDSCSLGLVVSPNRDASPMSPESATVVMAALPKDVAPGASIEVPVTLTAPAQAGSYAIAYDMRCSAWFEAALNLPYHDDVVTVP